jgi:hypothetical protein
MWSKNAGVFSLKHPIGTNTKRKQGKKYGYLNDGLDSGPGDA